nr:hypothetical protein [Tanacetum cinerariifolium]
MTTLADKAILLGADNRPPMLEKDMYDSWKSQMELYMTNRQHGRMILESVKNGPLIWLSIEENGLTRPKKYFELSAMEAIQADCDVKATNIILQGIPPEERECKLYDEFDKFTYKNGESLLHHNVYSPSSSIPLLEYALLVNQQPEFSQPESGLIVAMFQKGEGHMSKQCTKPKRKRDKSWFKDKVLLVQAQTNGKILHEEELAFLADPTIAKAQTTQNVITYNAAYQAYDLDAYDSDCDEIKTAKFTLMANYLTMVPMILLSVNEILTAELERYKDEVRILKEGNNIDLKSNDKVSYSCAQTMEIDNLKQTLLEHLKEKESLKQTVTLLKNDFQKEESRNIDRELALEKHIKELNNNKAQQLEPKLYDGIVIQKTNAIVIRDSKETLMLAEESRSKMLLKQKDMMMTEKKVNTKPINYNYVNSEKPNHSTRPTQVVVPKELPKVSLASGFIESSLPCPTSCCSTPEFLFSSKNEQSFERK